MMMTYVVNIALNKLKESVTDPYTYFLVGFVFCIGTPMFKYLMGYEPIWYLTFPHVVGGIIGSILGTVIPYMLLGNPWRQ